MSKNEDDPKKRTKKKRNYRKKLKDKTSKEGDVATRTQTRNEINIYWDNQKELIKNTKLEGDKEAALRENEEARTKELNECNSIYLAHKMYQGEDAKVETRDRGDSMQDWLDAELEDAVSDLFSLFEGNGVEPKILEQIEHHLSGAKSSTGQNGASQAPAVKMWLEDQEKHSPVSQGPTNYGARSESQVPTFKDIREKFENPLNSKSVRQRNFSDSSLDHVNVSSLRKFFEPKSERPSKRR